MEIYLIGAGPGDPELLTLKAARLLKEADVVLYDALVDTRCLEMCRDDAIKEFVGKRKNRHLMDQQDINALLLKYAKEGKRVVRLKGGTPFVFGRGHEELSFLSSHGFEAKVIPGVSSSTAVPESFGIPLIDRGWSDSYRTITGHDMKIFEELVTYFHPRENLVIMMGAHNLKAIAAHLLKTGFPSKTPVALLSKGTTEDASMIVMTLGEAGAKDDGFYVDIRSLAPLIIYVGETINAAADTH